MLWDALGVGAEVGLRFPLKYTDFNQDWPQYQIQGGRTLGTLGLRLTWSVSCKEAKIFHSNHILQLSVQFW